MWDEQQDPSIAAALVRDAPDMIATFDLSGQLLQANPSTLRHFGNSFQELRELPVALFVPDVDTSRLDAARERTALGEEVARTVRYRRKDGEVRGLSARTSPLVRAGKPTALLVWGRDVTDEVVRARALRESDQRFRSLVAAFDRAFFVVDLDGRVAGLVGRWIRTAGLETQRWLGRTPAELYPETQGEPHTSAIARARDGEDVTYEWDYPVPATGGTRRLRIDVSPMRDAEGVVTGIADVAADITRRLRAQAEATALRARLMQSERTEALGNLVSGVAHERSNPLAAVLNFAEDLLHTETDLEHRAALEVVRAQALRSRVIGRDLLTYARRGDHRPHVPQTPGPIIDAVVRALRPGLGNGVSLDATIRDGDTVLEFARSGFEQVLTNLIVNGGLAARRNGRVVLVAERRGAEYLITVRDDGPGIPAEALPRLFEPFFTTKPTGQGVGLGLSVSLGIVQEHHGTLEAKNFVDGAGAVFTLTLPVSGRAASMLTPPTGITAQQHPSAPSLSADAPGLLIVDDEEPIRRALTRFFQRRGWRVDEALDGLEGLALLSAPEAASRYVAVLRDLRMPGLDGRSAGGANAERAASSVELTPNVERPQ